MNERIDIQTCRDHHVALRFLLQELSDCPRDARKLLSILQRLKAVLIAHLRLEDNWLYPHLRGSADPVVSQKAAQYSNEMGGIKQQFLDFYSRWSDAEAIDKNHDGFCMEASAFSSRLETRMHREDTDLYVHALSASFRGATPSAERAADLP